MARRRAAAVSGSGSAAAALRSANDQPGRPTRVFISYSRKDSSDFAETLRSALAARGYEAYLDKEDILPTEPWKERLGALILAADAVAFVISPQSVASDVCAWEAEEAERLGKKVLPVVHIAVPDAAVPARIARLNYIFMRADDAFDRGVETLAAAIETDIDWVREHTRLSGLAATWERERRRRDELIAGAALKAAETWRGKPRSADLRCEPVVEAFLSASRQDETRRARRTTWIASAVAAGALALAGVAGWQGWIAVQNERVAQEQRGIAETQKAAAEKNEKLAEEQRGIAVKNEQLAKNERDNALTSQSRFLADLANQKIDQGDLNSAVLLALEALPDPKAAHPRPHSPEAEMVINRALHGGFYESAVLGLSGRPSSMHSIPRSSILAIATGSNVELWDTQDTAKRQTLSGHTEAIRSLDVSADGKLIMTSAWDGTVRIWDHASNVPPTVIQVMSPKPIQNLGSGPESGNRVGVVTDIIGAIVAARRGSTNPVAEVVADLSPDGDLVATASTDNKVRVWNARSSEIIFQYEASGCNTVRCSPSLVLFDPGGQRLFANSSDGEGTISNITSGQQIVIAGATSRIISAAFSADGTLLATSSDKGEFNLWDTASGKRRVVFDGAAAVAEIDFAPGSERLVTAGQDGVSFWNAVTGEKNHAFNGHTDRVTSVAFSPDGSIVVTASDDGKAAILDAKSGSRIGVLGSHAAPIKRAIFLPEGVGIATVSDDGTARLWRLRSGEQSVKYYNGHSAPIIQAAFAPAGNVMASCANDGEIRLWDRTSLQTTLRIDGGKLISRCGLRFSHDGQLLAYSYSGSSAVRLWDIQSNALHRELKGHGKELYRFYFNKDGTRLVTLSYDGTAVIWNVSDWSLAHRFQGHGGPVTWANISIDETRAVTANAYSFAIPGEDQAFLWDLHDGQLISALTGHGAPLTLAITSPNSKYVVTAAKNGVVRIWHASDGTLVASHTAHTESVTQALFSPDGRRLLTMSSRGSVKIWETEEWTNIFETRINHGLSAFAVSSPDGKRVLAGSGKGQIPIIDWETGKTVILLDGHSSKLTGAAFSGKGEFIVTADGAERTIFVWDARSGKVVDGHRLERAIVSSLLRAPDDSGYLTVSSEFRGGETESHQLKFAPWPLTGSKLIEYARSAAVRCLTATQRVQAYLDATPPDWCITGALNRNEESKEWQPLWPYEGEAAKRELLERRGAKPAP